MSHAAPFLLAPLDSSARRRHYWTAVAAFTAVAVPLLWSYAGSAATLWMYIFHPSDITTWDQLLTYVADLRVPIPVLLSLAEIAEYRLTGDLVLMTRVVYPTATYLAFVLALWPASATRLRLAAAFVLAVVYLWGLRIVHFANPQTYDVIFPALVLAYVVLLGRASCAQGVTRGRLWSALGAGLALTLAELTRPFFIYLLPLLVVAGCLALWKQGRRPVALFLLPVLLLSGSWHLHIARTQGQLAWTNHSGYNLSRNWTMVEEPPLVAETGSAPLADGRWLNLNTPEHSENSRRFQAAVAAYIRTHPVQAFRHAMAKLRDFLAIPTGYYNWHPDQPGLRLYRWTAWVGLAWLGVQLVVGGVALWRRHGWAFIAAESQLIAITTATVLVLALGEAGEEARLAVTLLPLLAALPVFGCPRPSPPPAGSERVGEDMAHVAAQL